jgi:SAM-dependent methyltransferase
VLNVGAGTGSYEPADRELTAVEPSEVMIAQRPPGAAPVVRAMAESLPFADGEFDAAMTIISDHHWSDRAQGLRELRRVARRAVVVTWDQGAPLWTTDYLPRFRAAAAASMPIAEIARHLGGARIEPLPVPWDCVDGFLLARRPEALLDASVRGWISVCSLLSPEEEAEFVRTLSGNLESGAWRERYGALLALEEHDVGLRLLVAGD